MIQSRFTHVHCERVPFMTLLTASAELAWDLHGEFQHLRDSSYQAGPFVLTLNLSFETPIS